MSNVKSTELTLSEFLSMCEPSDDLIKGIVSDIPSFLKDVISFFYNNRSQVSYYTVTGTQYCSATDLNRISAFQGFMVQFDNNPYSSSDKLIAFVDPNNIDNSLLQSMRDYLGGNVPTHAVVLSYDREVVKNTIEYCSSLCSTMFRDSSVPLFIQRTTQEDYIEEQNRLTQERNKQFNLIPVNPIIDDYLMNNVSSVNTTEFISKFFGLQEHLLDYCDKYKEILKKDSTQKQIKFSFSGFNTERYRLYCNLMMCMKMDNPMVQADFYDDQQIVYKSLEATSFLYGHGSLQFYDFVKNVSNFPKLTIQNPGYDTFVNMLDGKVVMELDLEVVELTSMSKSTAKRLKLNSNSAKLINPVKYFGLDDSNFDLADNNEKELRSKIHRLYDVLSLPNDYFIDLTNLVLLEFDNMIYIGTCFNYRYLNKVKSYSCALAQFVMRDLTPQIVSTSHLIFISPDRYRDELASFTNSLYVEMKRFNKNSAIPKIGVSDLLPRNIDYTQPKNALGIEYSKYFILTNTIQSIQDSCDFIDDGEKFVNFGLFSTVCRTFRDITRRQLLKEIPVEHLRKKLDCFGCLNPKTNNTLFL